jgi:hypothetical protein
MCSGLGEPVRPVIREEPPMKAVCWHGTEDFRADNVPDSVVDHPSNLIIKVTRTVLCASDLRLFGDYLSPSSGTVASSVSSRWPNWSRPF